eukprot:PITA_28949
MFPPIHNEDHVIHLIPGSVPPNIRPYRYPYSQKSEIERMVVEMLKASIIQPSQSSFSSPVVLVHKKDGSWHMCSDYRELNKLTIKDKFPIPVIDELLDELHGSIYFTKLNLHSGYHQIRMNIEDILKMTFRTHEAIMNFFSCLLALPMHLQHFKDHGEHVDRVLQLLEEKQLYAKRSKCFFGVQEVEYQGHIVSHEGVKVDPSKIIAIKEWRIPTSIKHLRGFIGLTGYYRKFVKNYGRITASLTTLLKKDAFSWTPEATKAFEHLKEAMCQALVLATPDFKNLYCGM